MPQLSQGPHLYVVVRLHRIVIVIITPVIDVIHL
jgi:hypothetical protein